MLKRSVLFLFFSLSALVALFCEEGLVMNPDRLILEQEADSSFFHKGATISLENQSSEKADLFILAPRPEIRIDPARITLSGGERVVIAVSYQGELPKGGELFFPILVRDTVRATSYTYLIYSPESYSPSEVPALSTGEHDVLLTYYYSPTCKSCRAFLEREIPRLERELDLVIALEARDIFQSDNMTSMKDRLTEMGVVTDKLPILDTGQEILAGEEMITRWLEPVLRGESLRESTSQSNATRDPARKAPLWLLVAGAGLLDGINPCAFSTLIFLLAYLGLRKRTPGEIFSVGMTFTLTVFLTYTAVGAGAFVLLRQSLSFEWISNVLKWGGAGVLFILAALNLRDYTKVRRGELSEMALQLSPALKRAVHKSVRGGVRSAVPLLGACAMGFTVTIYELGCTGQIYLPTLYLMIQRGSRGGAILLILYNLAFILPLVVVFTLAYKGLTSDKLSLWFQERLGVVKLITSAFFLIAGAAVLLI